MEARVEMAIMAERAVMVSMPPATSYLAYRATSTTSLPVNSPRRREQEAQPGCPAPQDNLEEVAAAESTVAGDAMENLARLVGVRNQPASPEL